MWPDAVVSDESLSKAVSRLRKALGRKDVVETVPRRGYRLKAAVQKATEAPTKELPGFGDEWFGRDAELADLRDRFDAGQRLVTLKGPSGHGKTRLAVQFARSVEDAVVFVDLTPCRSADEIVREVAGALDLPSDATSPRRVGYALARRGRLLVVLDNFEPVAQFAPRRSGGG